MKDGILQSSMSLILPPEDGASVPAYLSAVSKALGGRTDAALARSMGQPAHVLANWRRRKRIPSEYIPWFSTSLVEKIGTSNQDIPNVDLTARAAIVILSAETSGNPIGAVQGIDYANGLALGGLLALAQFVVDVADIHQIEARGPSEIAQFMKPLMRIISNADHLRAYRQVPQ